MLTAASASAAFGPSLECIEAGGCVYNDCPGGSGCCYCAVTREGCCNCFEDLFCAGLPTCSSSSQCPPGWACQADTCGESGVCVVHCGANTHHNVCNGEVGAPLAGGATTRGGGAAGGGGGGNHEEAPAHGGHGGHQ
ncbi:MAG TPA: hypothetical protein VFR32_00970 [Gaiellaceae bacterium]|nr:hypothetical protein [Gaiellaceae bacterium]